MIKASLTLSKKWLNGKERGNATMDNAPKGDLADRYPLLFSRSWTATRLNQAIDKIDPAQLVEQYCGLRLNAAMRSLAGLPYFVGHNGVAGGGKVTNRLEEHTAIALRNLDRYWPLPDGGWFQLLDYQVPLKSRETDTGVGDIDLLGVNQDGRLMIIELKVGPKSGGRGDAPPTALMEGLRYAAIVEADANAIEEEALQRFGVTVSCRKPIIVILAPKPWWNSWLELDAAGDWSPALARLVATLEAKLGIGVTCLALEDVGASLGGDGLPPWLERHPELYPVSLSTASVLNEAIKAIEPPSGAEEAYLSSLRTSLWTWADRYHSGELDGGGREGRPPVLAPDFAEHNVVTIDDGPNAGTVRAKVVPAKRHRYFGSLRSSQALTQSVFGTLKVYGKLDVLSSLIADCGRLAFFKSAKGWDVELEHELTWLQEPRPTSLDALMVGPQGLRIAIECKLAEAEFGRCSRSRPSRGNARHATRVCDGSYRYQAGRATRCALSEIGIGYWASLPDIFDWPADQDHNPCLFGETYQLGRNALAALAAPGGIDRRACHVLVVYDARNPAFQPGGTATKQWEISVEAALVPGSLRRISWQRILRRLSFDPSMTNFASRLSEKYSFGL